MLTRGEIEVGPYLLRESLDMIINGGGGDDTDLRSIQKIFAYVLPSHRQTLLGYGPKKTLLYQAVESGMENIVQFLIVECEANIEKGILKTFGNFPPLFGAIKNGDLSMVKLLVSHGANVNAPTYKGSTIVNEACALGKLSIAKYLMEKGADIYTNGHVMRSGQNMNYLVSAVNLGCDINRTDDVGRNPLIYAAYTKRYDIISYLIERKVDIFNRDKREDNALNIAIQKNDYDMINYMISSVYQPGEVVNTFEIQGCKMSVRQHQTEAFHCWKEAFIFREKYSIPKDEVQIETLGTYTPFKTLDELTERRFDTKYMMFEALNICIRLMTPFHSSTIDAAIKISEMFPDEYYVSNRLLVDIFRLNWENPDPLSNNLHSVFLNIIASHSNINSRSFNHRKALTEITMYIDFIEERVWPVLSKLEDTNIIIVIEKYANMIYIMIKFIQFFLDSGPSLGLSDALLDKLTRVLREEENCRDLPTTILHQAVKLNFPFGVKLLVQCGADINAMDHRNCIPLHLFGLSLKENKKNEEIGSFLVQYGSDVDAVNCDRRSVHTILQDKKIVKNSLDHISLKCLAARAISKKQMGVFKDDCPRDLIPVIIRHGGVIKLRKETRQINGIK